MKDQCVAKGRYFLSTNELLCCTAFLTEQRCTALTLNKELWAIHCSKHLLANDKENHRPFEATFHPAVSMEAANTHTSFQYQPHWTATCKRMKSEHFLTPYTKINSKWIKDLNIRPETIKILEKNIGKILFDINHSIILFDPPPWVMEINTKINKWDLIKLKRFCTTNYK